jgi:hypothetical protein
MFKRWASILLNVSYRWARRIVVLVIGTTVLLVGLVMTVMPGPAIVVIPLGLAILAVEFEFARRWLKRLRETGDAIARHVFGSSTPPSHAAAADNAAGGSEATALDEPAEPSAGQSGCTRPQPEPSSPPASGTLDARLADAQRRPADCSRHGNQGEHSP